LQERTKLVLGMTYYEMGEFDQALEYLKQVSEGDENYPRALLAEGWCYLKLQQYQNMIVPLEKLVRKYPNHVLVPEAYLLLGQTYLKLRIYDRSIYYFSKILNLFPVKRQKEALLDSLNRQLDQYEDKLEQQRTELILLESKIMDSLHLGKKRKLLPDFMIRQIQANRLRREALIRDIRKERRAVEELVVMIADLRDKIKVRSKDWRSFAEYGISRALYLKEREE